MTYYLSKVKADGVTENFISIDLGRGEIPKFSGVTLVVQRMPCYFLLSNVVAEGKQSNYHTCSAGLPEGVKTAVCHLLYVGQGSGSAQRPRFIGCHGGRQKGQARELYVPGKRR